LTKKRGELVTVVIRCTCCGWVSKKMRINRPVGEGVCIYRCGGCGQPLAWQERIPPGEV
jgi:predicted SprT family Zn-dependent metalloprotease